MHQILPQNDESRFEYGMTTLIVSNDKRFRSDLKRKLKHFTGIGSGLSCAKFVECHQPTVQLCTKADLIFIDLSQNYGQIFQYLDRMRVHWKKQVFLIFLSPHLAPDLILRAFRLGAFDFIKWPSSDGEWQEFLLRLNSYIDNGNDNRYHAPSKISDSPNSGKRLLIKLLKHRLLLIPAHSIVYIESSGSLTYFYKTDGQRLVSCSSLLHYIEITKEDYSFVQVHRKYLVNIEHVNSFNPSTGCISFPYDIEPIYSSRRMGANLKKLIFKMNHID